MTTPFDVANASAIAQARKAEELGRFGVELTAQTMQAIRINEKLEALFNQESQTVIPKGLQLIYMGLFFADVWGNKSSKEISQDKERLNVAYNEGKLDKLRLSISACRNLKELVEVTNKNLAILG